MDKALLQRKDLQALVAAIREKAIIFAPAADGRDGGTLFSEISSAAEISLGPVNTRVSVKGAFFPQREPMMRFTGTTASEVSAPQAAFVVFGARPCDARSLTWLDRVFGGGGRVDAPVRPGDPLGRPGDPYYLERRKNGLLIALACDEPCESCFCASVGGSPYGTEGADILASETAGDGPFLFEAISGKGTAFMEEHARLFEPAGADAAKAREARAATAFGKMRTLDFSGIKEKLDASFESPLWDTITKSCLGCGVCTYLCPTCHCFDITDESKGNAGIRLRSWDSCQYPLFTLHASGHNPRPAKKARMRQRIMHKYSYTVETADAVFCSGCGRCVRSCPVNLDIRQMLVMLKEKL